MKKMDKKIKRLVQSVRLDVPRDSENQFMEEFTRVEPERLQKKNKHHTFWPGFVAAASFVIVAVLFFFSFFNKSANHQNNSQDLIQYSELNQSQNGKIVVRSIRAYNQPARTFYFQSKDKDKVIIWIQKKN